MQHKWMSVLGLLVVLSSFLIFTTGTQADANPALTPTATPLPEALPMIETLNTLIADETCELPCWWGWHFGKDSLEQVQSNAVSNLGQPLFTSLEGDYIRLGEFFYDLLNWDYEYAHTAMPPLVRLWVDVNTDQLVASYVAVDFPTAHYVDFSRYLIPEVLSTYGVPDEVSFYTESLGYALMMVLKYESLNYYLRYLLTYKSPPLVIGAEAERLVLCNTPNKLLAFQLSVNLIPAGSDDILAPFENIRAFQGVSIEQISDLTIEQFTQIFAQPNQCFETIPLNQLDQKIRDFGAMRARN